MSNSNTILKNTFFLYIRMFLTMAVTLYTYRVVLNTLGVLDYGIYNVVGGVVTFFSFFNGTMASATQRFFSFALGKGDEEVLKKTFTVNLVIYISIALICFILLETIGLWFVNNKLEVSSDRFDSALMVFHYSVMMFVASVFSTPFMAIIIAHEDMKIYAFVSIFETIMKLGVILLLAYVPGDKLQLYGLLVLIVSVLIGSLYIYICIKKYKECQLNRFHWDKNLMKEILGFTGWTLFGQLTTVVRNQAITILLNQMFNPIVVAARAIAMNVATQINLFSNNFNIGLYPPIIKSYAASNKKEMFSLIFNGSKITFFLMWVFALPLYLEMEAILILWLKNPPESSVIFTRLALVEALINSISLPIATAARAPGKMKMYELVLGSIQLLIFAFSWMFLSFGFDAQSVFWVAIVVNLVMFIVRLIIVNSLIGFPVFTFFRNVCFPVIIVILVSISPSIVIHRILPSGFLFVCISVLSSGLIATITMYFLGINAQERQTVKGIFQKRLSKVINISK